MDKRSLLFVFVLSAAFLGVHSWFDTKAEKNKIEEASLAQEKALVAQKELELEVAARTASFETLKTVSFFKDAQGKNKLATGIALGDLFLTLAWEDQVPEEIYVTSGKNLSLVKRLSDSSSKNEPLFFGKGGGKKLQLPALSKDCPMDVQLLTAGLEAQVALGEQRGNTLNLPYHYLEETAIVLVQTGDEFLPVGVFDPGQKRIKTLNDFRSLENLVGQSTSSSASFSRSSEEFYVIENDYQQLVFSTRGGALAEINLPLRSKTNQNSLVKEINIDREILANSPANAHFPLRPYNVISDGRSSFREKGELGGYYPLLRRPIFNAEGEQKTAFPAEYYAFNIVGDDSEIAKLQFTVTRFEANLIQFEAKTGQRRIIKTFRIPKEKNGPYCLELDVQVDGDARNLWLTSGVPDVELVASSYSPLLRIQETKGKESDVETIDLPKKDVSQVTNINPNWISNNNGFLGIISDPLSSIGSGYKVAQVQGTTLPTRLTLVDPGYQPYPAADYPGYATFLPLKAGMPLNFRIFAGPFDEKLLKELDALYDDPLIGYNPEYAQAQSIRGWFSFISEPFAKLLFFLMSLFHTLTGSWALSIILLTIALKLMMYPLNAWQIKSSIKMQELGPKVKLVQEKYKKDPQRSKMEVMTLYKESGVNPITGCLPMLLQMPFLIGMFYLLKSSFPLRGASFIPGWINDLSAPDILFSWGQPIWFIGNEFHLLPILMGASMYLQQKLTTQAPKQGETLTDAQKQQKMMAVLMPLLFAFMFYKFPSGLNLYFMFSTLLGVLQQWWMTKKMKSNAGLG